MSPQSGARNGYGHLPEKSHQDGNAGEAAAEGCRRTPTNGTGKVIRGRHNRIFNLDELRMWQIPAKPAPQGKKIKRWRLKTEEVKIDNRK